MKARTVKVSQNLPRHLRRLARDKAYTDGHASVFRAAADEIERLQWQLETARALQAGVNVCAVDQERR